MVLQSPLSEKMNNVELLEHNRFLPLFRGETPYYKQDGQCYLRGMLFAWLLISWLWLMAWGSLFSEMKTLPDSTDNASVSSVEVVTKELQYKPLNGVQKISHGGIFHSAGTSEACVQTNRAYMRGTELAEFAIPRTRVTFCSWALRMQ